MTLLSSSRLRLPRVRPVAGEQLEHHDAEREQIGARVDRRRIEYCSGLM